MYFCSESTSHSGLLKPSNIISLFQCGTYDLSFFLLNVSVVYLFPVFVVLIENSSGVVHVLL